jgi:hypothetical protein
MRKPPGKGKMTAHGVKIHTLYTTDESIRKLIMSIMSNTVNYIDYVFNEKHVCCKSCTLKILTFYSQSRDIRNETPPCQALYTIFLYSFEEIHYNDLKLRKIEYDENVFFILYNEYFKMFLEYTSFIDMIACLALFKTPITINSITFLKHNAHRITDEFVFGILSRMDGRNHHEHVLFSRFLSYYIDGGFLDLRDTSITPLMNYCMANMEIKEVAGIYEKIARLLHRK